MVGVVVGIAVVVVDATEEEPVFLGALNGPFPGLVQAAAARPTTSSTPRLAAFAIGQPLLPYSGYFSKRMSRTPSHNPPQRGRQDVPPPTYRRQPNSRTAVNPSRGRRSSTPSTIGRPLGASAIVLSKGCLRAVSALEVPVLDQRPAPAQLRWHATDRRRRERHPIRRVVSLPRTCPSPAASVHLELFDLT